MTFIYEHLELDSKKKFNHTYSSVYLFIWCFSMSQFMPYQNIYITFIKDEKYKAFFFLLSVFSTGLTPTSVIAYLSLVSVVHISSFFSAALLYKTNLSLKSNKKKCVKLYQLQRCLTVVHSPSSNTFCLTLSACASSFIPPRLIVLIVELPLSVPFSLARHKAPFTYFLQLLILTPTPLPKPHKGPPHSTLKYRLT